MSESSREEIEGSIISDIKRIYYGQDDLKVLSSQEILKRLSSWKNREGINNVTIKDNADLTKAKKAYESYTKEYKLYGSRDGPKIYGSKFKGLNAPNLQLTNTEIFGCDFIGSNLEGTRLSSTKIKRCSFRAVNFTNVELYGASFERVDLRGAYGLEKVKSLENVKFENCLIDDNNLEIICEAFKKRFILKGIPTEDELKLERERPSTYICHDCDVLKGQIHEYGCDMEICPFCRGQLISCKCIYKKLKIAYSDGIAVTYPVSDRNTKKFIALLNKKGRIPYTKQK